MEKRLAHLAALAKEQETLWYLGGLRIIKALEEGARGSYKIFEYREPAGTRSSLYSPDQKDIAFYIEAGEVLFSSKETTFYATPGTFLFLPFNVPFRYQTTSSGSTRMLTWTTPAGFAHQVTNMGEPGQAFVLAPPRAFEKEKMQQLTALLRGIA